MRSARSQLFRVELAGERAIVEANVYAAPRRWVTKVVSVAPAVRPIALATFDSAAVIAGSDSQVLLRGGPSDQIMLGPASGPLARVDACGAFTDVAAVDGDVSAWSCRGRIVIRRGQERSLIELPGDQGSSDLDVAGRYVAWTEQRQSTGRLVVYDTAIGSEAYHVDGVPAPSTIRVQADGTAVIMSTSNPSSGCPGYSRLAGFTYYTLAEPFAHESPLRACDVPQFELAQNRIAAARPAAEHSETLFTAPIAGGRAVDVAGWAGPPPRDPLGGNFAIDFDGRRVAWATSHCMEDVVEWRDASDTSPAEPAARCPVRLGRPRVDSRGAIRLPVSCPRGCRSLPNSGIRLKGPAQLYEPGFHALRVAPGARRMMTLKLSRRARAFLLRRQPRRLTFEIRARNVVIEPTRRPVYAQG